MDQNISEYSPSNTQALLRMVEALVAGYRNGGNVYVGVDEISAEWERQNLPCRIKDQTLWLHTTLFCTIKLEVSSNSNFNVPRRAPNSTSRPMILADLKLPLASTIFYI
jgi:hypothetical protein